VNLDLLDEFLGEKYDIQFASSGDEALEIAPRFQPGVILLDIMMPGLDGYETCRRLRSNPLTAAAKIIMVSARARTVDRLEGYQAGADDYLSKPFDDEELQAKVRVFLKLKSTEEIDQAKTKLLEVLQHSIRTPLSPIINNASELAREIAIPDHIRCELADGIRDAGERLLRVLKKAEQLVQLRSGLFEFDFAPTNLWRLVMDSLQRRKVDCARVSASLCKNAVAAVDAQMLQLVIDNLIDNALQYSDQGEIDIAMRVENGTVDLIVTDNGPGVPPEIENSIFEPFSNPEAVLFNQGDGLGLAIARDVVTAHGGSLTLQKEAGASFCVTLPACAP